jgi:hypothetical protein
MSKKLKATEEWAMPLRDLRVLLLVSAGGIRGAKAVETLIKDRKWSPEDAEAIVDYIERMMPI